MFLGLATYFVCVFVRFVLAGSVCRQDLGEVYNPVLVVFCDVVGQHAGQRISPPARLAVDDTL